ncbi:MAG TPA: ATP-binding protein [Xanthobacteraceae bacterium]|jgi:two-component system NtrC family sensor kinase|nr:ATP-binding protein [Xanthobacteraceae bacterium]
MRTNRESAVRLLQLLMIASLVFPAALFAYAALNDYDNVHAIADERIERSLDVLQEQALKVFGTVERIFPEVNEVVRGQSDAEIAAASPSLTPRLQRIVEVMPQVQSIALIGADGKLLASSDSAAIVGADLSSNDSFKAPAAADAGTFVSDMHRGAAPGEADTFDVSRRMMSSDHAFRGVIAVAVKPRYFDDFFAMIEQSPGNFYDLVRADGVILARYPLPKPGFQRLSANSGMMVALGEGAAHGLYSTIAEGDGMKRRIGFRRLPGYPLYSVAGADAAVIRSEWLAKVGGHLIFGLPVTLLLFFTLWVALRRTQRLHDEAERREAAEDALRQAQRLEAIGQLTGGVAHDFNNLLMIVSGTVQRLRRHVRGEKETHLLDTITTATERGESLTRQLLTFSRRQMLQPSVIDLAERLPDIKDMLSRSLRGDIEIRVGVVRRPCFVKVDPSEFELALLNLAFNARDAMPSGGTLTITAKPVMMRGKASEEGLSGEFVAVRVADTGTGIPPEVLPRVFEPFFTTKEIGKGTGLGLSQVYGFARQSGGIATIATSTRRGTAVTILLPRTWEAPAQPRRALVAPYGDRHAGRVLLVEDNAEVAAVGQAYLEELGYQVRHAASAQAGLDVIERGDDVDLLFSDILMPGGMNGLELADTVQRRFPKIAVLLTTGYSSSAQDAVRRGFEVLQKPYDLVSLERALRDVHHAAADVAPLAPQQAAG